MIVLLATLLDELEVGGVRLRIGSLGTLEARARLPRAAAGAPARPRRPSCREDVRSRIDLNPLRAFDSDHPGTREVMAGRAAAARPPRRRRRRALRRPCASCSTAPSVDYEVDPTLVRGLDYYTRTVFEFTSDALGAQSGVGGGGRYDGLVEQLGGPPTPGCGWAAGIERMLLARRACRSRRRRSTCTSRSTAPAQRAARVRDRRRGAPRAPERAARARRALAQGPAQAGRPARRPLRCDRGRRRDGAEGHAGRRAARRRTPARSSRASCASGACDEAPPRANPYRDTWAATSAPSAPARRRASPAGCTAAATTAA